jgi:hypothetical protein
MASLYLSATQQDGRTLSLKPLTNRAAEALNIPLRDLEGYFLVEGEDIDASVIARVETEDAAMKLARLLGLR